MPSEGVLDAVCQAFGCTPMEALEQPPQVVWGILEYRAAVAARDQLNQDASKLTDGQQRLLLEINRVLEEKQGPE